jgi:hypothetical protein
VPRLAALERAAVPLNESTPDRWRKLVRRSKGHLGTREGWRGLLAVADDASPREKTVRTVANLLLATIRAYGRENRGHAAPSQ